MIRNHSEYADLVLKKLMIIHVENSSIVNRMFIWKYITWIYLK